MSTPVHFCETTFGFQYGNADVSRVCSHKGMVVIRVASRKTGRFVDVTISPAGQKMQVSSGQYNNPNDVESKNGR